MNEETEVAGVIVQDADDGEVAGIIIQDQQPDL
jgi:hypothetical protein